MGVLTHLLGISFIVIIAFGTMNFALESRLAAHFRVRALDRITHSIHPDQLATRRYAENRQSLQLTLPGGL